MTGTVDHLVFLHGRNAKPEDDRWMSKGLDPLLRLLDRSPVSSSVSVHQPNYVDLLDGTSREDINRAEYPETLHRPYGDELDAVRQAYKHRRRDLLAVRGRRPPSGARAAIYHRLPTGMATGQLIRNQMPDVQRYTSNQNRIRRAVMQRLRQQLPHEGRMVILGHSLGSVIALDYLHFLPRSAYVELLITLGSPLPNAPLRDRLVGAGFNWPWDNLGGWVNLYDPEDLVTGGDPLEPLFRREVVDVEVDNGKDDQHSARSYLSHGTVVRMAGPLLSYDLTQPLPDGADRDLIDAALIRALGRRIEAETPVGSNRRRKMAKARKVTEQTLLDDVRSRRTDVDTLAYSLADIGSALSDDVARLERLLALFFSDPFAPFDTEYHSYEFREGIRAVGLELGVRPRHLREMIRVVGKVKKAHEGRDWSGIAKIAGLVAIAVAAPFAAPVIGGAAGLAGAAALTHGLAVVGASVGGGMMAGVGVVGAVSAGGAALAARQVSKLSSGELEAELARLQAAALLEKRLSVGTHGREAIQALIGLDDELRTLAATHRKIEGDNSRAASELDKKRQLVKQARTWLVAEFDSHEQWQRRQSH